jgi:hypothetical protein
VTPGVYAYVVLTNETFDSDTGDPEWDAIEDFVSVTWDPGGGDGYLKIQYDAGRGAGQAESTTYTDASAFFVGDWKEVSEDQDGFVQFDFWADDNTPYDLELRFKGASDDLWRYNLSTAALGSGWVNYTASLVWNDSLWYHGELPGGGGEQIFLNDLELIDWIGIYIYDDDTAGNVYRLDNFQLMTPEPAEYALAISALAVTWLSLRRKRKQKVAAQAA